MENSNAPFRVGQRVICIESARSRREKSVGIRKGDTFTVNYVWQCPGCKRWLIGIGIPALAGYAVGCYCCSIKSAEQTETLSDSKFFAPIQDAYEDMTKEIAKQATQTRETPDKINIPEPCTQ